MPLRRTTLTAFLVLLTGAAVQAQPSNPSFETVTGRIPNSWTATGRVGFATSSFNKTPTAGSNMLYLINDNAIGGTLPTGSIASTTSLAAAMGTTTAALNTAAGTNNTVTQTPGGAAIGGSAVTQSFTVAAGSQLSFDWDFFTTEDTFNGTGAHNDFGFVTVNGVVTVLGRVNGTQGFVSTHTSAYTYIPFRVGAGINGNGSHISDFLFETGNNSGSATSRQTDYNSDPLDGTFTSSTFAANRFIRSTLTFPSAGTVQVGFGVINVATTGVTNGSLSSGMIVDNLIYNATPLALPEPGTLALVALGLSGAALLRRRRA